MEFRPSSVGSSVMSGSPDISMYKEGLDRSDLPILHENVRNKNYFLRWKGYEGNLLRMVENLKFGSKMSDVTVACQGGYKAHLHKLILASASLYFHHIFEDVAESKHPTIILSGIRAEILELLTSYMYCGFIDVPIDKLSELISAGRCLKIKGLMDMKEELVDNMMYLGESSAVETAGRHSLPPPPAHLSSGTPSSFLLSPLSEPRMTPTFGHVTSHKSTSVPPPMLPLWPTTTIGSTNPAGDSLHLLAAAAHIRSSSEEERSSSPEASPLPPSGHTAISAVSAISAIAASRASLKKRGEFQPHFRFDRENEENDPTQGPSSNSDNSNQSMSDLNTSGADSRAINLSIRSSEPLATLHTNFTTSGSPTIPLLNISHPAAVWPKREELPSAFRPLGSSPGAESSGDSSQNSSPLDFSNWRLGSGYSRFFGGSDATFNNALRSAAESASAVTAANNRSTLMAVAAAISAAASAAAANASSERHNGHEVAAHDSHQDSAISPAAAGSPPANGFVSRRGPRTPRTPRRTSDSHSTTSRIGTSSPVVNTGANWKSRQPTECEFCKRMFSNKFNLKQHILNMHSTGGEVRCEQCGKMVKNKWYLRRHKVTHHGAPLRKYKKDQELMMMGHAGDAGGIGGLGGDEHPMDSGDEDNESGVHVMAQS